jgi:succinoglycan biosynthesis transport protein ExoP
MQDNRLMPMPAVERSLDRPLPDLSAARSYGPAANEPSQLRDYLFVVLKRKWLILSLCLVITSLVAVQMFRQPSIFEAEAMIRIEQRRGNVLATSKDGNIFASQPDPNFWGTQIKLLESPALARQVVLTLDLQNNKDFTGGSNQGGFFSALRGLFTRGQKKAPIVSPAVSTGIEVVDEVQIKERGLSPAELAALEPYEDMIMGGETIGGVVGTNLFTIKYRHSNPEMAQKVANTIAEVFANNNLTRSRVGSTTAELALTNQIAQLQSKVKVDQEKLFDVARARNISPTPGGDNIEKGREIQLSTQVLDAQDKRKTAEAVYNSAKAASDPFSVPEVQKSTRVNTLRERISQLKERRDALLQVYTKEWPEVKKVEASIKPLEEELNKAATEAIVSLKGAYEAAKAHEESLYSMYAAQRGITSQQTRDQIDVMAMNQDLETSRQSLQTLKQRLREIQVTSGDRGNEVSVENYSRVPRAPIGPARTRNVMIALILSLVAGIALAFLLDFLDDTVKSIEDIDRYIHLPALALIPSSRGDRGRLKALPAPGDGTSDSTALAMLDDVRSPIAESYRHLRTSLLLSSAGQPPKTILVTSSQPSEGKTTTAINTAFMLAQTGVEVLIIDCDLRRPRLHAQFELTNAKGLTTWLSGERDLDKVLQVCVKQPNLKILTSGPVPPNPAELIGSDEMRNLLAQLGQRFAHIIIDSPPAISFTDASILSTMVDGVMLVVHGGRSSRAVVRRAKQQLLDVGAHIFGVVLNNVKRESQDYYYSGYYSNYYSTDDPDSRAAEDNA